MSKIASAVVLCEAVRKQLESWVRAQFTPQQVALRSRILLMAAEGKQDLEIADELDVNRHTPALWRKRFQTEGLDGVWEVQPGRGRKPLYDEEKVSAIVAATLQTKKGRCGTFTHDYVRHGTTTLFAALEILEGKVIGQCFPRHRHQEFLKFLRRLDEEFPEKLNLHLVLDNYGTHKHPKVQFWL